MWPFPTGAFLSVAKRVVTSLFGGGKSNSSSSKNNAQNNASQTSTTDVVRSVSAEGAYTGIQSERVRNQYKEKVASLDASDSKGRTQAKVDARAQTPAVTKAIIEQDRPIKAELEKTSGTANKTNASANKTAGVIGDIGKGFAVVGVSASVYNVATAENKAEAVAVEGASWAGAVVGGEILGAAGASVGGPWGAGIGAVVGAAVGGFAGESAVRGMLESNHELTDADKTYCFVAGTKIKMNNGQYKNIEDVVVGDFVKSYNFDLNLVEDEEVLAVNTSENTKFVKIEFEDGTVIVNTFIHPYYIKNKGWCSFDSKSANETYNLNVGTLETGDFAFKLIQNKISEVRIKKLTIIEVKQRTYNLSHVKNNKCFFANDILVHNKF